MRRPEPRKPHKSKRSPEDLKRIATNLNMNHDLFLDLDDHVRERMIKRLEEGYNKSGKSIL